MNVLIEPEKYIAVEVQCGPKNYRHDVSHCMTVNQLKMRLFENNEVAFFYKHVNLVMQVTNKGVKQYQVLDNSLPLHYYTSDSCLKLAAVGSLHLIKSKSPFGKITVHQITNKSTVLDLKEIIMKSRHDTSDSGKGVLNLTECLSRDLERVIMNAIGKEGVRDISMFVNCGNDRYNRLESDTVPVCQLLPEDKTVYFIEYWFSLKWFWPVHYQGKEVGQIFCYWGNEERYETVLSVKLRIQEEMGIPVNCINVKYQKSIKNTVYDDHLMERDFYIEIK